ncbi:MAG: hypothetical protein RMI45_00990 [Ignisphaera sp.]|nr:hypothetical protein [Ignisphaera sp.]MDW8084802.1 hypothetical protein [Ignisphaera sp.]
MLAYIIDEVLSFREKGTPLHRGELLPLKLALLTASVVVPLTTELGVAIVYTAALWLVVLLIGLRRTALYIAFSAAFLFASLLIVALALQGNVGQVVRSLLVAASTLSVGVLIFATLSPKHVGRLTPIYLLLVILGSVLREMRDAQIVLRARGEAGLRYYLRLFTVSIEVALSRTDAIIDSLKARGIELNS